MQCKHSNLSESSTFLSQHENDLETIHAFLISHSTTSVSDCHYTQRDESFSWCRPAPVISSSSSSCFCIAESEAVKGAQAPRVIAGLRLSSRAPYAQTNRATRRVTRCTLPPSSSFTFRAAVPWDGMRREPRAAADSSENTVLNEGSKNHIWVENFQWTAFNERKKKKQEGVLRMWKMSNPGALQDWKLKSLKS